MKKTVSLILALVMCLSLCACAATGPEPTETESAESKKEKLLASATALRCDLLYDQYKENPVRFKETYVGKAFTVTGYIYSIDDGYICLTPFEPALSGTSFYGCVVYLSNEDLMKLSKGEIVTIVGELAGYGNEIGSAIFPFVINNAHFVDNVIEITATAGELTYHANGYYYIPLTTDYVRTTQYMFAQEYWYKIKGSFSDDVEPIINGKVVKPGDKVRMKITGERNYGMFNGGLEGVVTVFPMIINSVESIEVE